MNLPSLVLPKAKLDSYEGEVSEHLKCDFSGDNYKVNGETPSLEQR